MSGIWQKTTNLAFLLEFKLGATQDPAYVNEHAYEF